MSRILSFEEIKRALPYVYPILMVDRAKIEDDNQNVCGLKCFSANEMFFQGHFPNHPIVPGVLQIESVFQTAQLLVRDRLDPVNENEVYLKKLNRIKFRKPVIPGDRLFSVVNLTSFENNEAAFTFTARTEQGVTCQGDMVISVRPRVLLRDFPEIPDEANYVSPCADINGILKSIPHRFPFVFLDNVMILEEKLCICTKNITADAPFIKGYTGDYAVVPGSLMCEMLAQTGCANMLSSPANKGKIGLFAAINEFESHAPAFPGDKLTLTLRSSDPNARVGKCQGEITVGERLIATIALTFFIVDPPEEKVSKTRDDIE